MSNNISIEEYNKLISDFEYWKARALKKERSRNFYETLYKEEKSWHKFYKEEHGKRVSEYMSLRQKYEELKEQKQEKVTFISLKGVKSLSKAQKIAEEVRKLIDNKD